MDKFDIYKYNFYTLLPVNIGSSKEEIDEVYERYKRLNANDTVASKQILELLEEHYALLQEIGLEEYNRRIKKAKDNRDSFEKFLDDPENYKHCYTPITARVMNYENEFMQRESDKVEFDESKVGNVNTEEIRKIGKKFVVLALTVAVAITGVVSAIFWARKNDSKEMFVDDSVGITQEDKPELYMFDYIVEYGDTVEGLYRRFKIEKVVSNTTGVLTEGDIWHIYTTDNEIAEEWQRIYDIKTTKPVMVEWDEYTIVSGDTPMSIADKFDVPVEYIIRFNSSDYFSAIPDAHTCYAGYTIKIPTKILTGEDAYNYNLAEKAENNSMKAVG